MFVDLSTRLPSSQGVELTSFAFASQGRTPWYFRLRSTIRYLDRRYLPTLWRTILGFVSFFLPFAAKELTRVDRRSRHQLVPCDQIYNISFTVSSTIFSTITKPRAHSIPLFTRSEEPSSTSTLTNSLTGSTIRFVVSAPLVSPFRPLTIPSSSSGMSELYPGMVGSVNGEHLPAGDSVSFKVRTKERRVR